MWLFFKTFDSSAFKILKLVLGGETLYYKIFAFLEIN